MGNLLTFDIKNNARISSENCNIYTSIRHKSKDINDSDAFLGVTGFEGIPQNFVINLLTWVILNMLFIVLRKKAWNYGRMAVMQKEELKWTDMFYGDDISVGSGGSGGSGHVPTPHNHTPMGARVSVVDSYTMALAVPGNDNASGRQTNPPPPTSEDASNTTGNNNNSEAKVETATSGMMTAASGQRIGNMSEIKDSGYFSWIKIVFTLTDQQYKDKCGPDCVSYLSFQRHLIFLALIITCCSLMIILPINMHPKREMVETADFAKTTIINLSSNEENEENKYINFLWAHVVLSILYLFISIGVMRHYSKGLQFLEEGSSDVSHSICIIGLNKDKCQEDILRAHLVETYPGTEILEVSFAYDISKLQSLEFQRLSASSAKRYFEEVLETEKRRHENDGKGVHRPTLRPYLCGVVGCCFAGKYCFKFRCKETDAIDYYTKQETKYTEEVDKERQRSLTRPVGIAFVTFSSTETAERIVEDYACSARLLLHTPESKYTKQLLSNQWIVKFAPVPEDIYWENLTLDFKMWYVKFVLINFLLAIIVIIFSTPVFVFSLLAGPTKEQQVKAKEEKQLPIFASAILDTLPTGMVWVLGVILISLVYQSDALIGFWTKTAGNLSEMIKIFFFLTFMVIALPALGVTSISYFLNQSNTLSWSCIFFKENGALFVNYVCTSSLTGTAAELMRLPELFVYAVKLCFARSLAEVGAIRKSVLWDFQIGSNYAWMMLHFALFTCFSVIYPLVTPFGLLYLILKHLVDRYNIYFAYAPCKVEKEVHATAVNFVIMSMFMLQINLLAFVHFYIGKTEAGRNARKAGSGSSPELRALQVFSLLGFSVTAALFLGQVCFNVCADFSPIHHFKNMITDQDEVLEVGRASTLQPQPYVKRQNRGSQGSPSQAHSARSSREGNEAASQRAQSSTPTGIIGGETKVTPASERTLAVDHPPSNAGVHPAATQVFLQATSQQTEERTSIVVSSNYTGSGKPYGRYIPPLLRPEFIRLVSESQTTRRPSQEQQQPASDSVSVPSRRSGGSGHGHTTAVDVISEKSRSKQ